MKKSCLFIGLMVAGILLSGCVQAPPNNNEPNGLGQPLVGNDADEHGCIGSAGYTWCEAKQKCLRSWEENCVAENTGNVGGNTELPNPASVYCEEQGGSLRIEDTEAGQVGICTLAGGTECEEWAYYRGECPAGTKLEEKAGEFCNQANLAGIFVCGNYVKVVSSLLGGGSTYYALEYYMLENGEWDIGIQCPIAGPDAMTEECKALSMEKNCVEKQCAAPKQGIETKAKEFCTQPNVSAVFVCGEYAKAVSSMTGGGSTFYKLEEDDSWGNEITCPVVGPDAMTEECRLLTMGANCIETKVC
ncbi:MAG: DUF333 domain-containing protein [archaeon]